ncbi:hypothetical protein NUACC26_057450 [Scytonema sp. NUACC26]
MVFVLKWIQTHIYQSFGLLFLRLSFSTSTHPRRNEDFETHVGGFRLYRRDFNRLQCYRDR